MNPDKIVEAEIVSPVPNHVSDTLIASNETKLNFPDAMREVLNGNRIMRISWMPDAPTFCELRDTFLQIFVKSEWHQWIINDGDMSGIDWIVVPKETK